jgi:hypothetical protein
MAGGEVRLRFVACEKHDDVVAVSLGYWDRRGGEAQARARSTSELPHRHLRNSLYFLKSICLSLQS